MELGYWLAELSRSAAASLSPWETVLRFQWAVVAYLLVFAARG
jgi:hypothetical protein